MTCGRSSCVLVCRTDRHGLEYLPHDFPPAKTDYDYYAKWEKDGTTARIHDLLRSRVRQALGRDAEPSAAVLDAQSVKTSCNVEESGQGIDAAKRIRGRKRHIATDTLGLLLAVVGTAASVSDSAAGKGLLSTLAAEHPKVSKIWVDGGYQNTVLCTVQDSASTSRGCHAVRRRDSMSLHAVG